MGKPRYSAEPEDPGRFTRAHDRYYTAFAGLYGAAVWLLPVWKTWLARALPHIEGPRVLEVSFGTGYLLARYAERFETHGIDYNRNMVATAQTSLARVRAIAKLIQGNVECLPYRDGSFDSLVNTMAFSGYPDGVKALAEMKRVLRPGGKLIMIDFSYPSDGNWIGTKLTALWKLTGDVIRDMPRLFRELELDYTDEAIGGSRSVHLYVATKSRSTRESCRSRTGP